MLSGSLEGLCTNSPKYHPRQWVVHSDPFYYNSEAPLESHPTAVGGLFKCCLEVWKGFAQKVLNTAHGSGWFIQILSTTTLKRRSNPTQRQLVDCSTAVWKGFEVSTHCRGWD